MRLSISKSFLARQYNNQPAEQVSAYDTPFAGMPLPIFRKYIRPNIPVPGPSYAKQDGPFREAGSGNTEFDGVDALESRPRSVDGSAKGSSPTLQHYMDQSTDKTIERSHEPRDCSTEHDTSNHGNNALASVASEDTASCQAQPISPDGDGLGIAPVTMEGREGETSNKQHKPTDLEKSQEHNEHSTYQLLETESRTGLEIERAVSRTIHILGNNAVGKFFAHALAGAPKAPPVTLLIHRPWLLKKYLDEGSTIRLLRGDRIDEQSGFNVELTDNLYEDYSGQASRSLNQNLLYGPQDTIIDNLVVTTEGYTTISALAAIQHRLQPSSTICFTQDSVGIIDYVNSSVFPDATQRPNYILGSMSHEVHSTADQYSIVEHEIGTFDLTTIPREAVEPQIKDGEVTIRRMDLCWQPSSKYLMRTLHRAPDLRATSLNTRSFYKDQLENLAITSVLGPVSVLYDCFNSQLLYNYEASRTIELLLEEISRILRSLPEVSQIPSIDQVFSSQSLKKLVFLAIRKSGKNRTSMLLDVRQRKKTKIDFYNGYLLRRAEEFGIDCPRLEMITSMVKGKQNMRIWENHSRIPFKH